MFDGHAVALSGTGQWKTLNVTAVDTGEVIIEKKFRKKEFNDIITHKEYGPYIEALLEKAMVKMMGDPNSFNIDAESYEEVRALSDEIEVFDPED